MARATEGRVRAAAERREREIEQMMTVLRAPNSVCGLTAAIDYVPMQPWDFAALTTNAKCITGFQP